MPRSAWFAGDVHLQPLSLVQAIREPLVRDTRELWRLGVHSVAIMSNDPLQYPEDSFENMHAIAHAIRLSLSLPAG